MLLKRGAVNLDGPSPAARDVPLRKSARMGQPRLTAVSREARLVLLVSFVVLAAQAIHPVRGAWAETENEPEIQDACGDPPWHQGTKYADICSGAFRGLWELVPKGDDPAKSTWQLRGLETELRLFGEVPDRPQFAQYVMRWDFDGCRHRWFFNSPIDTSTWTAHFSQTCSGGSTGFSSNIPPEHVSVQSDRIVIRLFLAEELAPIAHKFFVGQQMPNPSASTFLRIATSEPDRETLVGWDSTSEGHSFVIGQDRPPDPE